jgi:hypothetical protein
MLVKLSSPKVLLLSSFWLCVIGSGLYLLGAYDSRPGSTGTPLVRWPEESPIRLDPVRPTLLIFLHPRCPCSRASIDELVSFAASHGDRFSANVILYRPKLASEDWDRAEAAVADDATIPGFRCWNDPGGQAGRRFGVETSGHVLLYDPSGNLLFCGGITPSRGHRGENLGLDALVTLVEGRKAGHSRSPIFGCPILDPRPNSGAETTQ